MSMSEYPRRVMQIAGGMIVHQYFKPPCARNPETLFILLKNMKKFITKINSSVAMLSRIRVNKYFLKPIRYNPPILVGKR